MREVTAWDAERMLGLFGGLGEHLAVEAVLAGAASGRVWVNAPAPGAAAPYTAAPGAAVVWVQHRVFVAGEEMPALNGVVREIAGAARARGDWGVGVYGTAEMDWEGVLQGLTWKSMAREYWEIGRAEWQPLEMGEHVHGLTLRAVDERLLAQSELGRLDQLREEMCSERVTVDDFLARSFGVCLLDEEQGALAGWCLSEYNCGGRCEVGIEVLEEYRRQGWATLLTRALCEEAFARRGMERVGWHCLAANTASAATARRAGLRLARSYSGAVVLLHEGEGH